MGRNKSRLCSKGPCLFFCLQLHNPVTFSPQGSAQLRKAKIVADGKTDFADGGLQDVDNSAAGFDII